jgi:hypothetical protein
MAQHEYRNLSLVRFEEHYEGVFRVVRVLSPWPRRIEETHGFWSTHCRLDGDRLRVVCSNGVATYMEEGSDDRRWRGRLIEVTGDNPVEEE